MNRDYIENTLLKIGIPASVKGFGYIADAVQLLDKNLHMSMTKALYPTIAEKNNTTWQRVERAIRHALEIVRSPKGNYDEVEHYLGFMNCQNSNSLKMLYMKIKQECEENEKTLDKQEEETGLWGIGKDDIRRIVREELNEIMGGIE